MYVSLSPRAQFFANLGRLGGTAARATSAVLQRRRAQQVQAANLDAVADGGAPEEECTPCIEEEARQRREAQDWFAGRR